MRLYQGHRFEQELDDGKPLRRWSVKAFLMSTFYCIAGLGVIAYAVLALYANFWREDSEDGTLLEMTANSTLPITVFLQFVSREQSLSPCSQLRWVL